MTVPGIHPGPAIRNALTKTVRRTVQAKIGAMVVPTT
jgi:hypothetical protein